MFLLGTGYQMRSEAQVIMEHPAQLVAKRREQVICEVCKHGHCDVNYSQQQVAGHDEMAAH